MFIRRSLKWIRSNFERLRSSRVASKMASGVFWLSAGTIPAKIATLLATFLVVRILGRIAYGEFTLVRSTVNTFVTVAGFGMGRTAAKYVSELLVIDRGRAGRIVALNYLFTFCSSLSVAVIFCVGAPWLCRSFIDAPHLVPQVRFSSLLLILTAMAGAQTGALTGLQAYKEIALSLTLSGIGSLPFFVCGARFWGLTGAVVGFATTPLLNCFCNSYFIHRQLKKYDVVYDFRGCWREIDVLWNFCLPSTLASLLMSLASWWASILLVRQHDGVGELGVFDAARQVQTAVLYFPVLAANVVIPSLSELNSLGDAARYRKTVRYNVLINAIFTLAATLALLPFVKMIMNSFGYEFESGAGTLAILLLTSVVMSVSNVYGSVLTSLGELWFRFWTTLIWSASVACALISGAPFFSGASGLALAMMLAYAVQTLIIRLFIQNLFEKRL